jgi:hypothetical protein
MRRRPDLPGGRRGEERRAPVRSAYFFVWLLPADLLLTKPLVAAAALLTIVSRRPAPLKAGAGI